MAVFCVAGPIRSGKTTRLAAWATATPGAAGLLMPDTAAGRVFQDIGSGATWPTAAAPDDANPLIIGRFTFSRAAFARANAALLAAACHPRTQWLLVDEVGPLELRGEGLAPALRQLLVPGCAGLVLVVRESLREAVAVEFQLDDFMTFGYPA